jgi:hypothetical protein
MTEPAFRSAYRQLREIGVVISEAPGEYRVNFEHGNAATEFVSDDLQAAVDHGTNMAAGTHPSPPSPPLGPLGPRSSRRSQMYRHNKAIAKARQKQKG